MHRPVLLTPPALLPVSLAEAKGHLRVAHGEEDGLIEGMVRAAVDHLDGWTGILGRCLVEQVWRQDFDRFERCLALPLGPVISVTSVTWRNAAGQLATVASASYALRTDAGGRSVISFDREFAFPTDLHESAAVAVTYVAGYPTIPEVPADDDDPGTPAQVTVPNAIKVAIMLMVGHWYENREATGSGSLATMPMSTEMLLSPYRRWTA